MSKTANTKHDIHKLLKQRWSPRAFSDIAIEVEKIQRMFEAARWSPSASNLQPWYFIIGKKGDETYAKIYDSLVEFNQMWTKFAPILIVSIGEKSDIHKYDVGQAVAHMSFQATEDGLYIHQMTGFDPRKIEELFEIPDEYEALSIIAVGYIGDHEILHPRMQKSEIAPRERKEIEDFVFSGKFEQKSKLI